jgi:hypothetical protein
LVVSLSAENLAVNAVLSPDESFSLAAPFPFAGKVPALTVNTKPKATIL